MGKVYTSAVGKRAAIKRARDNVYSAMDLLDMDLRYELTDLRTAIKQVRGVLDTLQDTVDAKVVIRG